jgi:hypothetical protein
MANPDILNPEIINNQDGSDSNLLSPEVINNPDLKSTADQDNDDVNTH